MTVEWIRCSERMPEEGDRTMYMLTIIDEKRWRFPSMGVYDGRIWRVSDGCQPLIYMYHGEQVRVIAWAPFPVYTGAE